MGQSRKDFIKMSGILTTARLVFKDTQARQTAIEAFQKIIAYTSSNEPDVLQYVCALPVDDTLGTEVYMIEEYVMIFKCGLF
jgi:hypothetical protein